jgi:hypothetical protein
MQQSNKHVHAARKHNDKGEISEQQQQKIQQKADWRVSKKATTSINDNQ